MITYAKDSVVVSEHTNILRPPKKKSTMFAVIVHMAVYEWWAYMKVTDFQCRKVVAKVVIFYVVLKLLSNIRHKSIAYKESRKNAY